MCLNKRSLCWCQQSDLTIKERGFMKKQQRTTIETLASEFRQLDDERLELDRKIRLLKKRLQALQESIQEFTGVVDTIDVPLVTRIGRFFITQIKKHREVSAYEYDFVEFRIIEND